MESEYSTAGEPGSPAKRGTKSSAKLLYIIQNCIPRRVWRYQREVIKIGKSMKNRQHNGQKKKDKRTNNDLRNITHKTMVYTNDVANIQWRLQALKHTLYVWFVLRNLVVLIMVKLIHVESDNVITQNQIPWNKCVAFYVDNASVNMGKRSSI
jgi:hypothetical protein